MTFLILLYPVRSLPIGTSYSVSSVMTGHDSDVARQSLSYDVQIREGECISSFQQDLKMGIEARNTI